MYRSLFGAENLVAVSDMHQLARQLGSYKPLLDLIETQQRAGGFYAQALRGGSRWYRDMVVGDEILEATRRMMQPDWTAALATAGALHDPLKVLASSTLSTFRRLKWSTDLGAAGSQLLGASDLAAAVGSLESQVDTISTLAQHVTLGPAATPLLGAVEASYRALGASIEALQPEPALGHVWCLTLAGEVPVRLTAAAVLLNDPDKGTLEDQAEDSHRSVDDPADLIAALEARTFDDEFAHRLEGSLASLHPTLPHRLIEAKAALRRGGTRAAGIAANELVEAIKHTIRLAAPDSAVREYIRKQLGHDPSQTPRIQDTQRLEYLASRYPGAAVAEAQVLALRRALNYLHDVKHGLEDLDPRPVGALVPAVEAGLALLLAVEHRAGAGTPDD